MMLPENSQEKQISEIELFIEYAVAKEEQVAARRVVDKYRDNTIALAVLLEFYKVLPEAREEAVLRLSRIDSIQGITLLAVTTARHVYAVVVSENEVHILGELGQDEMPKEILSYFGHDSDEAFVKSCGDLRKLEEFGSEPQATMCSVCGVSVGELHLLGCPVEICPWCDGQLNKCNCRFEKLDVENLNSEDQLDEFLDLLDQKGRIPFDPDQRPAYPGTSKGLDT